MSSSAAIVDALLEWLKANGTQESLLQITYLNKEEGHGVFAKQPLTKGQTTLEIPLALTMSIESTTRSDLAPVLQKHDDLPPDEVLALHLMYERSKGSTSFYAPFIQSLPKDFDLPIFWSDDELAELQGTNVFLLTQMMKKQLRYDFENLHEPLFREFPVIFSANRRSQLTLNDYEWAMSVIWSRAFGVTKEQQYLHVLCPAMDMFNHDVRLQNPLDDFVSYDPEKQVMQHRVAYDASVGEPLQISYGQYSNAKLLYSYGFVSPGNPKKGLDFWMKIPSNDPYFKLKQRLLDLNDLTRDQTYDFKGTLHERDVDERLLATLRVILMNEQEISQYKKAFEKAIISVRNEQAVYESLQSVMRRKLQAYITSVEEDEAILKTVIDWRRRCAVQVRLEDKLVMVGVIQILEQWKNALAADPSTYPPDTTRHQQ